MIRKRCTPKRHRDTDHDWLFKHIKHNQINAASDNMSLSSRSLQSIFSNEDDRKLFVDCFRRSKTDGPPGVIHVPKIVHSPGLDGQSIISHDTWPSNDYTASSISDLLGKSFTETSAITETTGVDGTDKCAGQKADASSKIDRISTEFSSLQPAYLLAHFPAKLHYLLSQSHYNHILSWNDDGKSFVVNDVDLFEQEILHNECFDEMTHFRSFQKQLQRYKFKAMGSMQIGPLKKSIGYFRDNFERSQPGHCEEIYRDYVEESRRKREEKKRKARANPGPDIAKKAK